MPHVPVPGLKVRDGQQPFLGDSYPVKNEVPSDKSKVKQWLFPDRRRFPDREPEGIVDDAGVRQPMGIESHAMPKNRLIGLAVAAFQKWAVPPAARIGSAPTIKGFRYPFH
jgi:hypothetical protein